MRYRTVDCCPMAATQKMSCAPLSPLAASSAGSFNNSPVNSGILPTDSPEEPIYEGRRDRAIVGIHETWQPKLPSQSPTATASALKSWPPPSTFSKKPALASTSKPYKLVKKFI